MFIFNNVFIDSEIFNGNFTHTHIYFERSNESSINLLIFDQKQIIPASINPNNAITNHRLHFLFYSVVIIFSCIFFKKRNFKLTKNFLPFIIFFCLCFNSNTPNRIKDSNLKGCPTSEFFNIESIKMTDFMNVLKSV